MALTPAEARASITNCHVNNTGCATENFIVYSAPDRHLEGSNYAFADGHVKWYRLEQTVNPSKFLWGKEYCGTVRGCKPITKTDNVNDPVG